MQPEILPHWFGVGGPQVKSIAFSPNGEKLAVAYSRPAFFCIWDVETGSELLVVEEDGARSIAAIIFSPDGKRIAVGVGMRSDFGPTGREIRIRDADTGRLVDQLDDVGVSNIAFSPDGKRMATSNQIWTIADGELVREFTLPEKFWIRGIALSPDGSRFAASGFVNAGGPHPRPIAFVFEVETGRLVKSLECPDNNPHSLGCEGKAVDFHPDGKRLAIGTIEDAFCIWNIETDEVKTVIRPGGRWWAISLSSNGELLAASGAGGTVLIWDVKNEKEVAAMRGQRGSVYGLQFSPKEDLVASGGMDGRVRLWGPSGTDGEWGLVRTLVLKPPKDPRRQ